MSVKTNYEPEITRFLEKNFEPVENKFQTDEDTLMLSLKEVHKKITAVLPKDYVYESDVYGCLEKLGFKNFLISLPAEKVDDQVIPAREKFCYLLQKKTAAI